MIQLLSKTIFLLVFDSGNVSNILTGSRVGLRKSKKQHYVLVPLMFPVFETQLCPNTCGPR